MSETGETMNKKVIGVLRERYGNPLETDAVCLKHGANSYIGPNDVALTKDDSVDPDLCDEGVKCSLCGDWIIQIDPNVVRQKAEMEAVPMAERATHPLWRIEQ